jgi:anti-sigma regulatory factor (Ser/Thr protein kinase)
MSTASVCYHSPFDLATLATVRREIAGHLPATGLGPDEAGDAVLAVAEILGNAIKHGGGLGVVSMLLRDHQVHLVVSDWGPGLAQRTVVAPPATALSGRGLWLAFTLCSDVQLTSSARGTRVLLVINLPAIDDESGRIR